MLQPFKSFLNSIQKISIGASLFGISNSSYMEEDCPIEYPNSMDSNAECDPLGDPLAMDDPMSDPIVDPLTDPIGDLSEPEHIDRHSEEKIILIDVNALKTGNITDPLYTLEPDENPLESCTPEIPIEPDELTVIDVDLSANTTEEVGVPSDGSDSGLGSDTYPRQSINSASSSLISDTVPVRGNLKRRSDQMIDHESKRPKTNLSFGGVTVFYFSRIQGFGCVPSQGGCTLGMGTHHFNCRSFTLSEHASEQRRQHRQQFSNPRGSSSDDSETDDEPSDSGSEFEVESSGFLQPVPVKQRRALLKAAGIRKIDTNEKNDCRQIRSSREFCGCTCIGYCDPDTCSCSQSGIKCQVDRPNFPCGCTRDSCANICGRVEFNQGRVRTHFIHTKMRLDMEEKENMAKEHQSRYDGPDWLLPPSALTHIQSQKLQHYPNPFTDVVDSPPVHTLHEHAQNRNDALDFNYAFRDEYGTSGSTMLDAIGKESSSGNYLPKMYTGDQPILFPQQYPAGYTTYPDPHESLPYTSSVPYQSCYPIVTTGSYGSYTTTTESSDYLTTNLTILNGDNRPVDQFDPLETEKLSSDEIADNESVSDNEQVQTVESKLIEPFLEEEQIENVHSEPDEILVTENEPLRTEEDYSINTEQVQSEDKLNTDNVKLESVRAEEIRSNESGDNSLQEQSRSESKNEDVEEVNVIGNDRIIENESIESEEVGKIIEPLTTNEEVRIEEITLSEQLRTEVTTSDEPIHTEEISSNKHILSEVTTSDEQIHTEDSTSAEPSRAEDITFIEPTPKDLTKDEPIPTVDSTEDEPIRIGDELTGTNDSTSDDPIRTDDISSGEPTPTDHSTSDEQIRTEDINSGELITTYDQTSDETIAAEDITSAELTRTEDTISDEPICTENRTSKPEDTSTDEQMVSEVTTSDEPIRTEDESIPTYDPTPTETIPAEDITSAEPSRTEDTTSGVEFRIEDTTSGNPIMNCIDSEPTNNALNESIESSLNESIQTEESILNDDDSVRTDPPSNMEESNMAETGDKLTDPVREIEGVEDILITSDAKMEST